MKSNQHNFTQFIELDFDGFFNIRAIVRKMFSFNAEAYRGHNLNNSEKIWSQDLADFET